MGIYCTCAHPISKWNRVAHMHVCSFVYNVQHMLSLPEADYSGSEMTRLTCCCSLYTKHEVT